MKQYGKLLGRYDIYKYEIELLSRDDDEDTDVLQPDPLTPSPPASPHSTPPPSDLQWKSSHSSTPRSKSKKAAKKANLPKIVYCTLDELELCGEDINEEDSPSSQEGEHEGAYKDEQPNSEAASMLRPRRPAKPKSTVGIDIDTWRPFVTHDFLTQYHEEEQRRKDVLKEKDADDGGSEEITGKMDSGGDITQASSPGGYYKSLANYCNDDEDEGSPENLFVSQTSALLDQSASPSGRHKKKRRGSLKSAQTSPRRKAKGKRTEQGQVPPPDLVLSIWDFAGQEIYHAAQEAFFSERALYLVVWDMTKNSEKDLDRYVQFWIDLIQSRAPGSTIIVVATHADELMKQHKTKSKSGTWGSRRSSKGSPSKKSPVKELPMPNQRQWAIKPLCTHLFKHLQRREESRKQSIEKELHEAVKQGDVEQKALLGYLSNNRPIICPVFPVSCTTMRGFNSLTAKIISLSKPTKKNRNPFQLVDVYIPRFYLKVKEEIEHMRRAENHIVTMAQLLDQLSVTENMASLEDDSQAHKLPRHSVNDVRDAISFLSSIGEVVWFQPLSADGSHNKKSDLTSFFDFDKKVDSISDHSHRADPLSNTVPPMGRTRSSTNSNGTSNSCEDEGTNSCWREVEDLEAHLNNHGDISDMVFLSPHWLIDVLKRVLTHHLIDNVRSLTTSMSQNDLSRYFGENHLEHAKNGIVRWSLIEEKLMHIQINSPVEVGMEVGRETRAAALKKNIINSLR